MATVRKLRKSIKGDTKIIKERKQPNKSHCSLCGKVLQGVNRGTSNGPNRKYGGELCSGCSRKVIALKAKVKNKVLKEEDIPLKMRKYM